MAEVIKYPPQEQTQQGEFYFYDVVTLHEKRKPLGKVDGKYRYQFDRDFIAVYTDGNKLVFNYERTYQTDPNKSLSISADELQKKAQQLDDLRAEYEELPPEDQEHQRLAYDFQQASHTREWPQYTPIFQQEELAIKYGEMRVGIRSPRISGQSQVSFTLERLAALTQEVPILAGLPRINYDYDYQTSHLLSPAGMKVIFPR